MWIYSTRHILKCKYGTELILHPRQRLFHDYFVTHLPSSSLHPDSKYVDWDVHKPGKDDATLSPESQKDSGRTVAPSSPAGLSRETTVVRIPIKRAKHHFGVSISRGSRPYNEDAYQAGTICIPTFASRQPLSWNRGVESWGKQQAKVAQNFNGDSQVFYYGVFDGHGGRECSDWLCEQLHSYIEKSTALFGIESTINVASDKDRPMSSTSLDAEKSAEYEDDISEKLSEPNSGGQLNGQEVDINPNNIRLDIINHEQKLLAEWKDVVGGYFKRFKPEYFSLLKVDPSALNGKKHSKVLPSHNNQGDERSDQTSALKAALMYAFLRADLDFISAQAKKESQDDPVLSDRALNEGDTLDNPYRSVKHIGGSKRFNGGSTCSIALISTPTTKPYWDPIAPCTLVTAHVGDTRIILCNTSSGQAETITTDHHPSHPVESRRLRRYAGGFVSDSFGEERISGLANSRAFGDMASKRLGISAEPDIKQLELGPGEYSFLVLISDGISGALGDQEVVDIVKESKTPEIAAREIVAFATEVSAEADNATALVIRLGGWERRSEGGVGSMGTKEMRDWRKAEAQTPRRRT